MRHARRWAWALALFASFMWAPAARALELYALLDDACRGSTGLIVAADAETIGILDLDGEWVTLPRESVRRILVFNTLRNPIASLTLEHQLGDLAREVTLEGEDAAPIVGWPIQFSEDAIVIFDTDGKLHVEDIDRITRVRPARDLPLARAIEQAVPQAFLPGPDVPECPAGDPGSLPAVYPTRILSDQIKIAGFLAVFENGLENLDRFRVRSGFYARPRLYEDETKLALLYSGFDFLDAQELPPFLPLYLQWGSGGAYRSQGFFVLGAKPVEWLPNVEPVFAIRSDVKSSFFNASFVGNPQALAVGADFVVENRFSYEGFFGDVGDGILVFPHFNHLALTGVDWGAYSIAAGYYYPIVGIYANGAFREVLSPRAALIYRVLLTGAEHQFRLLYSEWRRDVRDPDRDDIRIVLAEDMRDTSATSDESSALADSLRSFSLDARFARAGADFELTKDLTAGVDQVYFAGSYRETFSKGGYALDYEHHVTSVHGHQRFGNYAALRAYLNYFDRSYRGSDAEERSSPRYRRFSLTVAIEFNL